MASALSWMCSKLCEFATVIPGCNNSQAYSIRRKYNLLETLLHTSSKWSSHVSISLKITPKVFEAETCSVVDPPIMIGFDVSFIFPKIYYQFFCFISVHFHQILVLPFLSLVCCYWEHTVPTSSIVHLPYSRVINIFDHFANRF